LQETWLISADFLKNLTVKPLLTAGLKRIFAKIIRSQKKRRSA